MKRDEKISKELKALLKKSILGAVTDEEAAFLLVMKRGFEQEEWDEWVTQVMLEVRKEREAEAEAAAKESASAGTSNTSGLPDSDASASPASPKAPQPGRPAGWRLPPSNRHMTYLMKWGQAAVWLILSGVVLFSIYHLANRDPMLDLTYNCVQVESDGPLPLHEFTVYVDNGDQRQSIRPGQTGVILRQQGVEVVRKKSGAFEVRLQKDALLDTTTQADAIQFETPVRQQAQVLLPDGTMVMLNAGSTLTYQPVSKRGSSAAILCLTGEAWIQTDVELQLASAQGLIHAEAGSSFEVLAEEFLTRLKLLNGQVSLQGKVNGGEVMLDEADTELWVKTITKLDGTKIDGYHRGESWSKTDVPIWTRTIREYRRAPLREFVRDQARWHGFGVDRLDCIAWNKKVSVAVCYQSQPDDLLAVVKGENIRVEYSDSRLSFCPETRKPDPLPMVIRDDVSSRQSFPARSL